MRSVIERVARVADAVQERCDFCSEPIPPEHRHMVEIASREIYCLCQACSILFGSRAASEGRYRLVPGRRLRLDDFRMTDAEWEGLRLPVAMAFLFFSTPARQVVACYPSPVGPVEAFLGPDVWADLVARNPALADAEPDVEALLINRVGSAREHFLVPIDECYRLTALVRMHWRGFGGGSRVWTEIEQFFADLAGRSAVTGRGRSSPTDT
jgi:hypothetical protein